MDKRTLKKLVKEGKSIRQIATEMGCSFTNARYWLKKHDLKTTTRSKPPHCYTCGETRKDRFYIGRTKICKTCHNAYTKEHGQKRRLYGIKLLGGKCQQCGYDRYSEALAFHHRDPTKKDPNFKSLRGWSIKRITKELAHCVLLCMNCHAEAHAGILIIGE